MVVIVNDEKQAPNGRYRQAPVVAGNVRSRERDGSGRMDRTETSSIDGEDPYSVSRRPLPGPGPGPPRSRYGYHTNGVRPPASASGAESVSSLKI